MLPRDAGHELLDLLIVPHVGAYAGRGAALARSSLQLAGGLFEARLGPSGDDDVRTVIDERTRDREADAARSTGDDRRLA